VSEQLLSTFSAPVMASKSFITTDTGETGIENVYEKVFKKPVKFFFLLNISTCSLQATQKYQGTPG
jgi:hypothetical protein